MNAGNITYSNTEFNPTGEDALTPDIGAMDYFGNFWEAGITWNGSTTSDSDYVTNNRLDFTYTASGNPKQLSVHGVQYRYHCSTLAGCSGYPNYTESLGELTGVTDKAGNSIVIPTVQSTGVSAHSNSLNVWDFNGNESLVTNQGPWSQW